MISGSVVFSGFNRGGMPGWTCSSSAMPEWKYFDVMIAGIDAIVPADGALQNVNEVVQARRGVAMLGALRVAAERRVVVAHRIDRDEQDVPRLLERLRDGQR